MLLIKSISIISIILTLILVVAVIVFICQVILNRSLTRENNDIKMIDSSVSLNTAKELVNRLNGRFEIQYSPKGEVIYYMKLPTAEFQTAEPKEKQSSALDIKNQSVNLTIHEPKIQEPIIQLPKVQEPALEKMSVPEMRKEVRIDHKFLDKVTSLINNITNTDNLIEIISSELCLSASQLNRKIKQMTGMTTSRFILVTRLNRAQKLLSNTQRQIGDVALDCGFNDFAYFSRSFKKEFDMTPTTFQRLQHSIN